jgi:hypothetical protein
MRIFLLVLLQLSASLAFAGEQFELRYLPGQQKLVVSVSQKKVSVSEGNPGSWLETEELALEQDGPWTEMHLVPFLDDLPVLGYSGRTWRIAVANRFRSTGGPAAVHLGCGRGESEVSLFAWNRKEGEEETRENRYLSDWGPSVAPDGWGTMASLCGPNYELYQEIVHTSVSAADLFVRQTVSISFGTVFVSYGDPEYPWQYGIRLRWKRDGISTWWESETGFGPFPVFGGEARTRLDKAKAALSWESGSFSLDIASSMERRILADGDERLTKTLGIRLVGPVKIAQKVEWGTGALYPSLSIRAGDFVLERLKSGWKWSLERSMDSDAGTLRIGLSCLQGNRRRGFVVYRTTIGR